MNSIIIDNKLLQVTIGTGNQSGKNGYYIQSIEMNTPQGWQQIVTGIDEREFATLLGGINADTCDAEKLGGEKWQVTLSGKSDCWEASEVLTLEIDQPYLRREQTYRFTAACETAICPGFKLAEKSNLRYTFPLLSYDKPLTCLPPMHMAVDWALPFPFHVWHEDSYVAMYGIDKSISKGTISFFPSDNDNAAILKVFYPDSISEKTELIFHPDGPPVAPKMRKFVAGEEVKLVEIIAAKPLQSDNEPLLEAQRIACDILLRKPPCPVDLPKVAAKVIAFYNHCGLWEPDGLGSGRGWYTNMWVRTQTGPAQKRGEMSGYYDFGWGEGIMVEMMQGVLNHWKRTGDRTLFPKIDEISRNMELFKRAPGEDQPYYDRSDGKRFGDFMMDHIPGQRIWTHSLGHTGSQLIQLYQDFPDYPNAATRSYWLAAAKSIAGYFTKQQKPNGDLNYIFDEKDQEVNTKPHRIVARAVVCGLWSRMAKMDGNSLWLDCACRLAAVVAPEINRYEYYNQMIDGLIAQDKEFVDGEASYYVLEGLVPLYAATRRPEILVLCKKAAAFGLSWTYFYDLPRVPHGVARGGQCCRMDDFPLLYPIGSAKSMRPLLELYELTGDPLFKKMAGEEASFIGHWQMNDPDQPWDGGIIHAVGQYCGKHWGPALTGQIDSGMATGNSLAAIEYWLAKS